MGNNPLICDERMKWLKEGEEQGWLQFLGSPPTCENFPDMSWDKVSFPESDG